MPRPEDCYYTKEHEWVYADGDEISIGITDFAQEELGDIVYVEVKNAGTSLGAGEELGTIESVKAVAEIYAPVNGDVVRLNPTLDESPDKINEDPFGEGWLAVMRPADHEEVKELMDHASYTKYLEEESQ